jgi:hypothetical protein
VLGDLLGDTRHFYWTPRKYVIIVSEEVKKLAFLFGVQAGLDFNGLGRVFNVDMHGLGILSSFQSPR